MSLYLDARFSAHSVSFRYIAISCHLRSITAPLPCKAGIKEGQSVDTHFWPISRAKSLVVLLTPHVGSSSSSWLSPIMTSFPLVHRPGGLFLVKSISFTKSSLSISPMFHPKGCAWLIRHITCRNAEKYQKTTGHVSLSWKRHTPCRFDNNSIF